MRVSKESVDITWAEFYAFIFIEKYEMGCSSTVPMWIQVQDESFDRYYDKDYRMLIKAFETGEQVKGYRGEGNE